ncbi:Versicolorin reductase [Cytospora mali]|uniref:Versicolorin reductase n=1 Tax=Cytospora mali TaxID=578113 RepID=A0A194UP80_CYTMA|nr:Versicolorin reductase [Valsa mali var. pyri (nom. inval.)]
MPPPQGTPNFLEGPGDYTVTKAVHSDTYPAIDPSELPPSLLSGRAVYISGASRGIGKAIAISFARGGASAIAIGARTIESLEPVVQELKAAAGEAGRDADALRVLCVPVDISVPDSVAAAARLVGEEVGGLDVVVQNAGILGEAGSIVDADPEKWWRVYEVNVRGQFLVAKYFLPLMLEKEADGLKTFVTVASVGAHLHSPGASQYEPGKLVNVRFAEIVDAEFADRGVSAWCVHPGNVMTDMTVDFGVDRELFVDTPQIGADTIVYLTSEKRQWLSGRYINCTWDMPELLAQEEDIVKGDKLKVRMVL